MNKNPLNVELKRQHFGTQFNICLKDIQIIYSESLNFVGFRKQFEL